MFTSPGFHELVLVGPRTFDGLPFTFGDLLQLELHLLTAEFCDLHVWVSVLVPDPARLPLCNMPGASFPFSDSNLPSMFTVTE